MNSGAQVAAPPARVVVVGGGFAGFSCLRHLQRRVARERTELVLVNPTDYLLYSPLLPEVATGVVEARHIAVSLRRALPQVRLVLGRVSRVDVTARTVVVQPVEGTAHAEASTLRWDRLVLTPGSVTRASSVPGVAEHGRGVKTLLEAVFLRDHLLQQLDLADATDDTAAGRVERTALLTVVAVGAGYTGTELVAQVQRWLRTIEGRWSRTRALDVRWVLVDVATSVLPELGEHLSRHTLDLLRRRGIEVRLGVSVESADAWSVRLDDGTTLATRTLLWGAGVTASPLVATLALPVRRGRLVVSAELAVPGAPDVWAAGDAAAVPDLAVRHQDMTRPDTPPTVQHAQRQGAVLSRNVAASLGVGQARRYRHHDLGLVADLGGWDAVARPLGVPLTGPVAKVVTRGCHLLALPSAANRVRVAADWLLASVLPPEATQLSVVRPEDARVSSAQATDIYDPADPPEGTTSPSRGGTNGTRAQARRHRRWRRATVEEPAAGALRRALTRLPTVGTVGPRRRTLDRSTARR